jgi:hypothetical protein
MTNISLYKINKYRNKLQSVHYEHPRYQLYLDKYIYYLEGGGPNDPPGSEQTPGAEPKKSVLSRVASYTKKSVGNVATAVSTAVSKAYLAKKEKLKSAYVAKKEKLKGAIKNLNPGPAMKKAVEDAYRTIKTESDELFSNVSVNSPEFATLKLENNKLNIDLNKDFLGTIFTQLVITQAQKIPVFNTLKAEYAKALESIEKIKKIPGQIEQYGETINGTLQSANLLLSGVANMSDPKNIKLFETELNKIIAISNPSSAKQPSPRQSGTRGNSSVNKSLNQMVKGAKGLASTQIATEFARQVPGGREMQLAAQILPTSLLTSFAKTALQNPGIVSGFNPSFR